MVLENLYKYIHGMESRRRATHLVQSKTDPVAEIVAIALGGCFILLVLSVVLIIISLL